MDGITYIDHDPRGIHGGALHDLARHDHVHVRTSDRCIKNVAGEVCDPWAVYEDGIGVVWTCTPATRENAEQEAALAGPGHRALPMQWAREMANAWNAGRRAGINRAKAGVP